VSDTCILAVSFRLPAAPHVWYTYADLARLWGRKEQTVRKWAMRARREGRAPHPDQVMTHRVNAARRYRLIRQDYAALLERVFFFRP